MTTSARIISRFIVQQESPISNLKLQKVLYYAQGWHLGLYGKALFPEQIQAWVHGPVVPDVFFLYRHFRWTPIAVGDERISIDGLVQSHLRDVMSAYGSFSAQQLELLSHSEAPWLKARGSLPPNEPSNAVITHESMKEYFGKLAHGRAHA